MDGSLPLCLQPYVLAQSRAKLSGTLSIGGLPRFAEACRPPRKDVQVVIHFDNYWDGIAGVDLSLKTSVTLRCERCLADIEWMVNKDHRLFIVRNEVDAQSIPDSGDFIICASEEIATARLVEDELLLSLPQIPMHRDIPDCDPIMIAKLKRYASLSPQESPFAVLKKL